MKNRTVKGILLLIASGIILSIGLTINSSKGNADTETNVIYESGNEVEYNTVPLEIDFLQDLHEMTHQKVYANKKWGSMQITGKQIDIMLEVLDGTEFSQESFYRRVLTDWKGGNFNNAVDVHNHIWEMQYGTVGKATRLLTPTEEQEYIERNFHNY